MWYYHVLPRIFSCVAFCDLMFAMLVSFNHLGAGTFLFPTCSDQVQASSLT